MTGTIRATANDILNQVGVEVGLDPVADPFSSNDQSYSQLKYLINTAGEELSQLYPWEFLRDEGTITTVADQAAYALPTDFLYLMNQTVWDRTNDKIVRGPLSPQEWAKRSASELAGDTLNRYFRLTEDQFHLYPTPSASGDDIKFEYIGRNWVLDGDDGVTYKDSVVSGGDTPRFNRTLMGRMLKVKFLEAKGFDSSKAQADLNQAFALLTARNKAAPILSTAPRRGSGFLNAGNVPETGYGG